MRKPESANILIVDDNTNICETLEDILCEEGYKVTSVGNLVLTKEKLAKEFYNVILVDLNLPNGSGLDLLRDIKKADSVRLGKDSWSAFDRLIIRY